MKHTVYHLTHCYETACGCDEIKDIGIFATYRDAVNAQKLVANKSGFKRNPDGFYISERVINHLEWAEGFSTWDAEKQAWID